MRKTLAVAVVLLMAASAQAAYYDAMNVNISRNTTSTNVNSTTTPGQPVNGFTAYWNNINWQDYSWTSPSTNSGSWVGAVKTSNGIAVPVSGASAFVLSGSAAGEWGAAADQGGGQTGFVGAKWRTNNASRLSTISATNVPFAKYDVYGLVLTTGNYNGSFGTDYSWKKLNSTEQTSSSFTLTWSGNGVSYGGQQGLAAVQILSTVPEPATMSLLVIGGIATLIRRRNRR